MLPKRGGAVRIPMIKGEVRIPFAGIHHFLLVAVYVIILEREGCSLRPNTCFMPNLKLNPKRARVSVAGGSGRGDKSLGGVDA